MFVCFIADFAYQKNKLLYYSCVLFIFLILCFGYTCGSDWRNYELMYYNPAHLERFSSSEFGFVYLVNFFRIFISDFWIFNAFMKILFIISLKKFFNYFISKPWSCIGISFAFKTLFMVIDCPMRYMIGMTVFLYSIPYFLKKDWIRYFIIVILSSLFHTSMIINGLLIMLLLLNKKIALLKIRYVLLLCSISICIALTPTFYQLIFENAISFLSENLDENRLLFYAIFNSKGVISFSTIWLLGVLIFILLNRKIILLHKLGSYIYTAAILYFNLSIIFIPLPTSFRLTIVFGYFFVLSIMLILKYYIHNRMKLSRFRRPFVAGSMCLIGLIIMIVTKDVYSLPAYYPYTNSIPYIFTGHLPYGYRFQYNYDEYRKTFGKLPQKQVEGTNLNNQQ